MVGLIADYLKAGRHRRGRHVLFIGSGAKLPPEEIPLNHHLQMLATAEVPEGFENLPAERRPVAQLEAFAQRVPEHEERCRRLRVGLAGARPAEGHVRLAGLIKEGYVPAVFTMEPHGLLEQSLRNNFLEPGSDYNLVVLGVDEPEKLSTALQHSTRVTIAKCGGDLDSYLLPLTERELTAHLEPYRQVLGEAFARIAFFTAYVDRDLPFLMLLPHSGGKVFWINPTIPLSDRGAFHELRAEEPQLVEYHKLQPEVTALLESRQSQRHILARDAGSFSDFFSVLGEQLKHHSRRRSLRRRRRDVDVLRGGPYRFLDYFDVEEAEFFFGREQETEDLVRLVMEQQLVVLFGKRAMGKSSLLRAGLMARLRHLDEEGAEEEALGRPLLPVISTPRSDPLGTLRRALLARAQAEGLPLPEGAAEGRLAELAGALAEAAGRKVLLIVDQFAEIFVKIGDRVREEFVEELEHCLKDPRVHLLISIREDYLGELFELRERLPGVMDHLYRLRRLDRVQAESAVVKPASNFNLTIERDLVERLLQDVSREGVDPAQLQIVMYRLYQQVEPPSRVISQRVYDQLGGAQKILSGYLDQTMAHLPLNERALARSVLRDMAASSGLRGRRSPERIAQEVTEDRATLDKVLAHLVDHRLLRPVEEEGGNSYELVHEYLADEIERWLGPVESQRRDLQDLLTRELNNYQRFGVLMDVEELRSLTDVAGDLALSPEELELILRSAAAHGVGEEYWFARSDELGERREQVFIALLQDPNARVRLTAYQRLPADLNAEYIPALAAGLRDREDEVQRLAGRALRRLERQLVALLEKGSGEARRLAVRAVGDLGLRRHVGKVLGAVTDDDPKMIGVAVETLRQLGEQRTVGQLLLRVSRDAAAPWAAAAVLGQLANSDRRVGLIQKQLGRGAQDAHLLYALAWAQRQGRDYPAARESLRRAGELVADERGQELVARLARECEDAARRADTGTDRWLMFGANARHTGAGEIALHPPLHPAWSVRTGGAVSASPVVNRGTVFIGSRDGVFYALDAARGEKRWQHRIGGRIEGTAALSEDTVFFGGTDGVLYALEQTRGALEWRHELKGSVRAGVTVAEDVVLVGDESGVLSALAREEPLVRWQFAAEGEMLSTPAVGEGQVFFGTWDGHLYAVALESGELMWLTSTAGPIAATPTVGDGLMWCGSEDGSLYALRADSGEIVWTQDLGGRLRPAPALAGERLVLGSGDGQVYCLDAASGDILWRSPTGDEILASAAVAGDVVYLGSKDGALYALDLEGGDVLWKHSSSYGVYSSPALADEALFSGFGYYHVVAFREAE